MPVASSAGPICHSHTFFSSNFGLVHRVRTQAWSEMILVTITQKGEKSMDNDESNHSLKSMGKAIQSLKQRVPVTPHNGLRVLPPKKKLTCWFLKQNEEPPSQVFLFKQWFFPLLVKWNDTTHVSSAQWVLNQLFCCVYIVTHKTIIQTCKTVLLS